VKRYFAYLPIFGLLATLTASMVPTSVGDATTSDSKEDAPPVAPVRIVSDEYFGVKVSDPYKPECPRGPSDLG